jgi:hypothetical protein
MPADKSISASEFEDSTALGSQINQNLIASVFFPKWSVVAQRTQVRCIHLPFH